MFDDVKTHFASSVIYTSGVTKRFYVTLGGYYSSHRMK